VHPVTARVSFPDGRFFAGCCRVVGGGGGAAAAGASALQANVWRLQSLPGKDAKALAAARQPLTVRFEAGRVSGFSGCNRLVGSYTVEGDTVTLSQLAGTMMACPEPAMALESAFRAALGGPLRFSIDGDRLSLKPASGEPLVLVAEVQRLDGDWKVSGFNNGRDAVVGLSGEAPVALSFEKAPSPGTRAATRASLPGSPTAGTVRSGTCRSVLQRCHRRVTFRS
jgi:putative lipoprotein